MAVAFKTTCPADDSLVWEGAMDDAAACAAAVRRSRKAHPGWAESPLRQAIPTFSSAQSASADRSVIRSYTVSGPALIRTEPVADGAVCVMGPIVAVVGYDDPR